MHLVFRERRVQKINPRLLGPMALDPAISVCWYDFGFILIPHVGDVSADQILGLFAHLHMDGRFGTPAESLQAHGTGSGKNVEKKLVFDHRAKQVEDRLSPEVARGPDRLVHRAFQLESFSFASNDSHLSAQTSRFIRKLVARAILDPSL